jgi:hypothetical protein
MRRWSSTAMAAVIVVVMAGIGPGSVRGDIPPRPPKPPAKPTLAGQDVPRPLHVMVAGVALTVAIASGGIWLARGGGRARRVTGVGLAVAAAAFLTGAGLLAYWSHAALRNYEAEKARLDAEYQVRLRNWHPRGPVRPPGKAVAPAASTTTPAPSPS